MRRVVACAVLAYALIAIAIYALVRMPLLPSVGDAAAARALARVRAALLESPLPALGAEASAPQHGLPVIVSLYAHARVVARGVGRGDTFGAALDDAAAQLLGQADARARRGGQLKLDRVIGRGFLSSRVTPLLALGAVPARDGIGVDDRDARLYLTVDDLTRERLWSGFRPLPVFGFAMGVDGAHLFHVMARALDRPLRWRPRRLFRFRAEEYLESSTGAVPVLAGHPAARPVTREALAEGARRGGDYLLRHLGPDGRFDYEYYLVDDSSTRVGYSLPRHAGAAAFLAELYALDHDPRVREGAERALDVLTRLRPPGCDGERACVGELDAPEVDLGGSALALVAAADYARTTGDARYAPFARGLAAFLLSMQKDDGDFCHIYAPSTATRDERTQLLYYSGEAAYALARLLDLDGGDRELRARMERALDRALRYLTHDAYDTFVGQFYVGEDHWTCMAVDAGWAHLPPAHRDAYARFCDAFGGFLRRTQFRPGEPLTEAQPQIAGAYGLTAVLAPHTTPVGSRSEATLAMWHLARLRGLSDDDPRTARLREQVLDGMRFLLARQLAPATAYLAAARDDDATAIAGGIPESDVEPFVRIDFVQHACSAMLRAATLWAEGAPGRAR